MSVTPAESYLQNRMQLRQGGLLRDPQSPPHRWRYAAQPHAQLYSTDFILLDHALTLTSAVGNLQTLLSTGNGLLSLTKSRTKSSQIKSIMLSRSVNPAGLPSASGHERPSTCQIQSVCCHRLPQHAPIYELGWLCVLPASTFDGWPFSDVTATGQLFEQSKISCIGHCLIAIIIWMKIVLGGEPRQEPSGVFRIAQ